MPFLKLWTTVKRDPWFLSLKNSERGVWFQCLIEAKDGENCGEIGRFSAKSYRTLAQNFGCDRDSLAEIMRNFAAQGKIDITVNEYGTLTVNVLNYQYWQELRSDKENIKPIKSGGKTDGKPPQIRLDKNRIDKKRVCAETNPAHQRIVEYFREKYKEHYRDKGDPDKPIEYVFKGGKDGTAIRDLLKRHGEDGVKALIDALFAADDKFYDKAGRTIGLMLAKENQLLLAASGQMSDLGKALDELDRELAK